MDFNGKDTSAPVIAPIQATTIPHNMKQRIILACMLHKLVLACAGVLFAIPAFASAEYVRSSPLAGTVSYLESGHDVQLLLISGDPSSGTFKLKFGNTETGNLQWNTDATAIQAALNSLASLSGNVKVQTDGTGRFKVYINPAAAPNGIPMLVVSENKLNVGAITVADANDSEDDVRPVQFGISYVLGYFSNDHFIIKGSGTDRKVVALPRDKTSDAAALMIHFLPPRAVSRNFFGSSIGRMLVMPGHTPGENVHVAFSFGLPQPGSEQPGKYYVGFSMLYGRGPSYGVTIGAAIADVARLGPDVDINNPPEGSTVPTIKRQIVSPFIALSLNFQVSGASKANAQNQTMIISSASAH